MAPGANALALLNPGMDEEGGMDPRTQMMTALALKQLRGSMGINDDEETDESESGGEVGKRAIDSGTVSPTPTQPTSDVDPSPQVPRTAGSREFTATPQGRSMMGDIAPAGWDQSTDLPSEFPATQRKETAHDLLVKAQESPDVNPSRGRRILRTIAPFIPIVGPMVSGELAREHNQGMQKVQLAREEYNTEAGLEQGQRDQALREKVAMANIATSRAMKTLMAGVQLHKADVTEQLGNDRNATANLKLGYKIADDGSKVPIDQNDLSEIQQRSMEVQQASIALKKAQTLAVPADVENRRKALEISNQRLSAALANMSFSQSMQRERMDFQETGPTTQMRSRSQQANVIDETSQNLINHIQAAASKIGPVMGRVGSLERFLGNPPPEFAGIANELQTYIALQPAAHGMTGMRAVKAFERGNGGLIQTPEALIAAIKGGVTGLGPMMEAGTNWTPANGRALPTVGGGQGAGAASPSSILKKRSPGSSANAPANSGSGSRARTVTRDPKTNKLVMAP